MAGSGTEGDPYVITNVTQLQAMEQELDAHYVLGNDIDASEADSWNGGSGFDPIGSCPDGHSHPYNNCASGDPFTGTFDGEAHSIANLTIDRPPGTGVGLFGLAEGAEFRNLRLENVNITGEENVGGLVGHMQRDGSGYPSGSVENISVSGDVTWSGTGSGSAGGKFGGIVGLAANAQLDNKNVFRGNVTGKFNVGGLVGRMAWDTTIGTSYAQGTVTSTAADDSECDAGNGVCEAGGIAGNSGNPSTINDVYAAVTVTAPTAGAIIGDDNHGSGADTLTHVYWDATIGPSNASGGPIASGASSYAGLSSAEMQGSTAGEHMNFDWDGTWQTVPGDYPVFQWEAAALDPIPVTGTITDGLDGAGVEGATVESTIDSATTDANGEYTLEVSALGDRVNATATVGEGFTISNKTIVATPKDSTIVDLKLGPEYNGSGTEADPYQVATIEDLQQMRYNLSAHYVLGKDLDASETVGWNDGEGFEPIGMQCMSEWWCDDEWIDEPFTGSFDGHSHTIRNLTINRSDLNQVGLFGYSEGDITAVGLENVNVSGGDHVGGVVGFIDGGTMSRSYTTGNITGSYVVGGLVGRSNRGIVNESYSTADVSANDDAGGLVGNTADGGTVARSYAAGLVDASQDPAGLIGNNGVPATDLYWDTDATGQTAGVRDNVLGKSTNVEGFPSANMTGPASETNMTGLDFLTVWATTDSYPKHQWSVDPASFDVSIDGTNAPVNESETLEVSVTVTNTGGLTGTQTVNLTDFTGDERDSVSVTLDHGESNDSITLQWTTLPGDNGTGSVTVSSRNDSGTVSAEIIDATPPVVDAGADQSVDEDTQISLNGTATDAVGVTGYWWDFGDGNASTGQNVTHVYTDPGSYTVTLNASDAAGNNGTDTLTISINDTTAPTADAGSNETVDEGTTVSFDGSNSADNLGIIGYNWTFGDGTTATGVNTSHTFAAAGTYIVTLNVSDAAGNHANDSLILTARAVSSGGGGGGSGGGSSADRAQQITVEPLTPANDGDGATTQGSRVTIENAQANTRISINVNGDESATASGDDPGGTGENIDPDNTDPPDDSSQSSRTETNVIMDQIEMTVNREGSYDLEVQTREVELPSITNEPVDASGSTTVDLSTDVLSETDRQFVSDTGSRPSGYVQVDHAFPDSDVNDVTLQFRVRKSYLSATGVDPGAVQLYRDEPTGWRALSTQLVGETDEYYRFAAESPGLSLFTIGTASPVFEIEEISIASSGSSLLVSDPVTVTVTVRNVGSANGQFAGLLTARGDHLDEETMSIPMGQRRTTELDGVLQQAGTIDLALNGRMIGSIEVVESGISGTGGQGSEPSVAVPDSSGEGGDWSIVLVVIGAIVLVGVAVFARRRLGG